MDRSLTPQAFASNNLDRSITDRRNKEFLTISFPQSLFLVVSNGKVLISKTTGTELRWFNANEISSLGYKPKSDVLQRRADERDLNPYLLGQGQDTKEWKYVLSLNGDQLNPFTAGQDVELVDLRSLMADLSVGDLAVAGHAVALSQWHQNHLHCGKCGARTMPIEGGSKRQCTDDPSHREYPRTDPVAIMLVESVDGQSALLGRPRSLTRRGPVLTCLSGFIEQGESIEEAVRREVREEAGVPVGAVHILGSQPWPVGRGGSCELMIGCVAKATSDELHVDKTEMDEVRWIQRDRVLRVVQASSSSDNPLLGGSANVGTDDFYIPPPWAIAHHLIKLWADQPSGWFSKL
ncbi:Peroxisomal NADH pyrophosphatase NUDT12 [Coccomyxa sp. Obi]|nr:Peroxisomal NADH pyrophosphatase NUDT12 [Coccomyxa sp. Obi]